MEKIFLVPCRPPWKKGCFHPRGELFLDDCSPIHITLCGGAP